MKIGGKERPIKFGINQSVLYCELRKINITQMNAEIASFASGEYTGGEFRDLMWSALKDGARVKKEVFDFDNLDVGDWIEELDSKDMEAFIIEMSGTLPKASASKKKVTPKKKS